MEGYEFYIGSLKFVVDFGSVILAAVLSAMLTMLTMSFLFIRRVAKEASIILTGTAQMKNVMEKCRRLFPIEVVEYHGTTFKRGMAVKITLSDKKALRDVLWAETMTIWSVWLRLKALLPKSWGLLWI